jgi:hypothetical protein
VRRRLGTALVLALLTAGGSTGLSHAQSAPAPLHGSTITAHRALALCGHSHLHFRATVHGYVRTGSFTRQANFSAGLFDSNRVPQSAGTGMQFMRYHGVHLLLPYKLVRRKPSVLISGTRITVYGMVICARARTSMHVQQVVSATH